MVIQTTKLPAPGETILGGRFLMNPGGKGANQAVAAARLGGKVTFITKTGNDMFGNNALQQFTDEGIESRYIVKDPDNPSGVALITVDEHGENSIVVAPGSNGTLSASDINEEVFMSDPGDIFLMQLEIPLATVEYVALKASARGNRVILNPAPAAKLSDDLLKCLFLITPNESEAELLTGIKVNDMASAGKAAEALRSRGVQNVIITLGATGALVLTGKTEELVRAVPVKAIDTTAAGDVFNGALAVALSERKGLSEGVVFANKAAGISVTRMGAQASAPFRNEIK